MIKYVKYFISTVTLLLAIYICSVGTHYPTVFFIGFSLFIILGDIFIPKNNKIDLFSYPYLLNIPIYINLLCLIIFLVLIIFVLGNSNPSWLSNLYLTYLNIDLINMKQSINLLDRIFLIGITGLFIGIMGTVPGHELTHRKKNKFDMFIGNWLLALSWDCAFAIEHAYGHHKNVCFPTDPASAKRGENIYLFILRAIITEQRDAWLIESEHLNRRGSYQYNLNNKMIIGYFRSLVITISAYLIGGGLGMCFYLICAFFAKSLLEAINYIEHYGLIREPGKPVHPRHSWNSNSVLSSIYLYNVTRHSSHHEKSNLKYWELEPYPKAPSLPQGYLTMLYITLFFPYLYHKIMKNKLIDWDLNYATNEEKNIAKLQNKYSGLQYQANQDYQ